MFAYIRDFPMIDEWTFIRFLIETSRDPRNDKCWAYMSIRQDFQSSSK